MKTTEESMSDTSVHQTSTIHGNPDRNTELRVFGAVVCVVIGGFLWQQMMKNSWSADSESGSGVVAVILFAIAALLPHHKYAYLDFTDRQVVTVIHYGWVGISRCARPLTDFNQIVVRHLCHTGEGADTYTGSVGLKPVDGTAVLWVKSFPATPDAVPAAAYEFAQYLEAKTGLARAFPGGSGSEGGDCEDSVGPRDDFQCLKCGNFIKEDEVACGNCGWTWQ